MTLQRIPLGPLLELIGYPMPRCHVIHSDSKCVTGCMLPLRKRSLPGRSGSPGGECNKDQPWENIGKYHCFLATGLLVSRVKLMELNSNGCFPGNMFLVMEEIRCDLETKAPCRPKTYRLSLTQPVLNQQFVNRQFWSLLRVNRPVAAGKAFGDDR